jgi:hypothetical protein
MDNHEETFSINFSISEVTEVEHFVAREEELAQMREELGNTSSRRTIVLHGLGGMGKTQLAVAYAKKYRAEYSAVFWLNSKDEDLLKQSFVKVAKRIIREHPSSVHFRSLAESEDPNGAVEAVKRWLDQPENNRWLIIYDNYDNPKLANNKELGAFDIRLFLPEAYQGAVIITTRSSQVKIGRLIPIRKLQDARDSLEILSHTSGRQGLGNGKAYFILIQAALTWSRP